MVDYVICTRTRIACGPCESGVIQVSHQFKSIVTAVTRKTRVLAALTVLSAGLAACSGGGSVNVGSGQSPDPATVDFPIFYVKRTIPMDTDDLRQLRDPVPTANLYKRDRASPGAVETNLTADIVADK